MPNIIDIVAKFINEASPGLQGLKGDIAGVEDSQNSATSSSDSFTDSLLSQALAGVTVGAVFGAVVSGTKAIIDAYGEAELVGAQLDAVLLSTGGAAGLQREQLDALADSLSKMSGVDDEVIARGEAVLLTFTKVGKDVFPAAAEAALNMSAAMGTDLQSSIVQVGKALNDPIQGASALRRVGVQLTDQQEEQVKSFMEVNDIASAQKIILDELAVEFGGVAEAMGDTTVGATNKLSTAWGNLMEEMGKGPAKQYEEAAKNGTTFIETLTDGYRFLNLTSEAVDKGALSWLEYNKMNTEVIFTSKTYADAQRELTARLGDSTQAQEEFRRGEWGVVEATQAASEAMDEYAPKFDQLLSLSTRISSETENYNDKQTDLIAKQAEIKTQIDDLIANGWWPMSDKVQDLQKDYDDLGLKSQDLALKHAEAMGKMQYDLLITKLSAGGLTDAEYLIGQQAGLAFGVFDQESVDAARNMDLVTQAVITGKIKVEDMKRVLDGLKNGYKIDVILNIIQGVTSGNVAPSREEILRRAGQNPGFAEGGISTGPESGYPVTLHGTEAVIPLANGSVPVQLSGMGGERSISPVFNFNFSSPITILDEQTAVDVIKPFVIDALREAQAQGIL